MPQLKIFKGVESDLGALEENVNRWFRQTGAQVVGMTGNMSPQTAPHESSRAGVSTVRFPPSDVVLFFLYELPAK